MGLLGADGVSGDAERTANTVFRDVIIYAAFLKPGVVPNGHFFSFFLFYMFFTPCPSLSN